MPQELAPQRAERGVPVDALRHPRAEDQHLIVLARALELALEVGLEHAGFGVGDEPLLELIHARRVLALRLLKGREPVGEEGREHGVGAGEIAEVGVAPGEELLRLARHSPARPERGERGERRLGVAAAALGRGQRDGDLLIGGHRRERQGPRLLVAGLDDRRVRLVDAVRPGEPLPEARHRGVGARRGHQAWTSCSASSQSEGPSPKVRRICLARAIDSGSPLPSV